MESRDAGAPSPDRELLELLRSSEVFGQLEEVVLASLAANLVRSSLGAGDVLFEEGETADALYVVVSGELEAYREEGGAELVLSRVTSGSTVGEIQIMTGGKRTASVRAAQPTELARLDREAAYALGVRHPSALESIAEIIAERLRRDQLVRILPQLFGQTDEDTLREVESVIEWVHLPRGERLIAHGESGSSVFVNVSGRLRAVCEEEGQAPRVLNDIEQGELVGEMAVFTGSTHAFSVYAVRDTDLARMGYEDFELLVQRHPALLRAVTTMLIRRMEKHGKDLASRTIQNVVVLPLAADVPVRDFCERLVDALGEHESTIRVSSRLLEEHMDMEGAAQLTDSSPHAIRVRAILGQVEARHRYVVFQADVGDTPWTRRCLAQADQILLVGQASGTPKPGAIEQTLMQESAATAASRRLILLHPNGEKRPEGTRRWLEQREVDLHHHLRWTEDADFARLARFLRGCAIGVALGGGGARGMAHIGVIQALRESGIPIDFVGGTSAGGAIAVQVALEMDVAQMRHANFTALMKHKPFREFNLPIVSLVGARRMTRMLKEIYGEARLEDLWLNVFCVSCSLAEGEAIVHRTGDAWRAVRATSALPGISVPFVHEGRLLIDGGVVDNLPGSIMRELCGGPVVLVDVSPSGELEIEHPEIPRASKILWSWIAPHRKSIQVPTIGDVIVRTATLSSIKRREEAAELAVLLLRPPIEDYGLLEFTSFDSIVDAGYRYTRETLAAWDELERYVAANAAEAAEAAEPDVPETSQAPEPREPTGAASGD